MEDKINTKIECPECECVMDVGNIYNAILLKITKYIKEMEKNENTKR